MGSTSKIIYDAWRNTKKPIIYETADAKGNPKRKEVDFAVPENNAYYDAGFDGNCNICGEYAVGGIPVKRMISSNYMDWAIHKNSEGTHVCDSCSFCMGMNPNGRVALFRYPIVAERTLHLCSKRQFRDFLTNPPDPPFVMILPTSQKKHLFSKSKVSYSKDIYFCNLEEITVTIDREQITELICGIEALRGAGFTKTDIEAGRISGIFLKKYGYTDATRILEYLQALRQNRMFQIALEVAQKAEEKIAEEFLGLKGEKYEN